MRRRWTAISGAKRAIALAVTMAMMMLALAPPVAAGDPPPYGESSDEAAARFTAPVVSGETSPANNGFETGDLSGWGLLDTGTGSWFAYTGTLSPVNGFTVPLPPEGVFAAVTDQGGPGTHILYQDVALPVGQDSAIAFKLFYDNQAGAFFTPASLSELTVPNQQYRVDIMDPTAPIDSVAPADVWAMLFRTEVGAPTSMAPTEMVFDLSAFAGMTVRIRFAEVDNQLFFQAGVDAVRIASCHGYAPTIFGTSFGETIIGTAGPDVIHALGGSDYIKSGNGDDVICAGSGADVVNAGHGADLVFGGDGDDVVYGSGGQDDLRGGNGVDRLIGNDGADSLYGQGGDDTLAGSNGNDRLYGGADNDLLFGGNGEDLAYGGTGNDVIRGGEANDTLKGQAGDDKLLGQNGHDTLNGGAGFDILNGGAGNDTCNFGEVLASC